MIPKIIHYVWVGNNPKPKDIKKCMKTWKKHLKDYKIIPFELMYGMRNVSKNAIMKGNEVVILNY